MMHQPEKDQLTGYVLSDLHIMSERSTAHLELERIQEIARSADMIVLNGDVFDFQWSNHECRENSVSEAVAWIRALLSAYPNCRFVFLIGNHDALPEYKDALDTLQTIFPNVTWEEFHFRLEKKLFLHGDAFSAGPSHEAIRSYREKCNQRPPVERVIKRVYTTVARMGLVNLAHRTIRRQNAAKRILAYAEENLSASELAELEDIYFGHTHNAFQGYQHAGKTFHNTGGALIRVPFVIHQFSINTETL